MTLKDIIARLNNEISDARRRMRLAKYRDTKVRMKGRIAGRPAAIRKLERAREEVLNGR